MAISTDEIELHTPALKKFEAEHPKTLDWLLHNFSVIKDSLNTGAETTDITALQAQLAALQAQVDAIELEPGPQGDPGEDGEDGEDGEQGIQGPIGPAGPSGGCGPLLAVISGFQITNEPCGSVFIGGT